MALDTKYQENTYKMPLVSICTLNSDGLIEILLKAFVYDEKQVTFDFILSKLFDHFGNCHSYRTGYCKEMINVIEN